METNTIQNTTMSISLKQRIVAAENFSILKNFKIVEKHCRQLKPLRNIADNSQSNQCCFPTMSGQCMRKELYTLSVEMIRRPSQTLDYKGISKLFKNIADN